MRARRSDLRQALAAFGTARIDDGAAATGLHADQKPMRAGTACLGGLVGALHGHGETRLRWLGVKGGGRRLVIAAGIEPVPQAANWPDLLPGSPVLSTLAPCSPSAQATSDAARELPVDRPWIARQQPPMGSVTTLRRRTCPRWICLAARPRWTSALRPQFGKPSIIAKSPFHSNTCTANRAFADPPTRERELWITTGEGA